MTDAVDAMEVVSENQAAASAIVPRRGSCTITFHVVVQTSEVGDGVVSIQGNIPELGNWQRSGIYFTQSPFSSEDWYATVELPFEMNKRVKWNESLFDYK